MKIKSNPLYFLILFFVLLNFAQAQVLPLVTTTCNPVDVKDSAGNIITKAQPCEWSDFTGTIRRVIAFIVTELAPALAFIFVLWGGFLMMLAGPSPGKEKQGKDMIHTALIGYVLVLISGFIIDLVLGFLGGEKGIEGLKFGK